jgi:serine/threonine-protein kinase
MAALPAVREQVTRVLPHVQVGEVLGIGITGPVLAVTDPEWGAGAAKAAVGVDFTPAQRAALVANEATKLRRAAGPHVLRVLASFPEADVPFLVTERLPTPSLRSLLRGVGPPPAPDGVALLLGLASALWSCHAAGMVHLDVKPHNVGVSARDEATLMDFGLARSKRQAMVHKLPAGTMPYAAPELVRTGDVGPATDVWGAGLLAHILLTGSYPGKRPATWGDLFRRGAVVPPPINRARPDLSAPVADVIDRSLAVDAGQRPADGQALFEQLLDAASAGFGPRWQEETRFRFAPPAAVGGDSVSPTVVPRRG